MPEEEREINVEINMRSNVMGENIKNKYTINVDPVKNRITIGESRSIIAAMTYGMIESFAHELIEAAEADDKFQSILVKDIIEKINDNFENELKETTNDRD